MKTACLITPLSKSIPELENVDYIGVDAGALRLLENGISMRFAIGDFDSMDENDFLKISNLCEVIRHPVMKDETDSELALRICKQKGYKKIILHGALHGRLDHTIANIRLLMYQYPNVVCMDENQKILVLNKGKHELSNTYSHISFFAIEQSIISLSGFLYPLDNHIVNVSDIFCVSNTIVSSIGTVYVHSGKVLCVQTNIK